MSREGPTSLTEADRVLEDVKKIVLRALAPYRVTVYFFGSYARKQPQDWSDIDIAVEPSGPLPPGLLSRLREELEESTIPRKVEVVDLRDTDPEFREGVRKQGIVWSVCSNV